jgi:hypothetical protein
MIESIASQRKAAAKQMAEMIMDEFIRGIPIDTLPGYWQSVMKDAEGVINEMVDNFE